MSYSQTQGEDVHKKHSLGAKWLHNCSGAALQANMSSYCSGLFLSFLCSYSSSWLHYWPGKGGRKGKYEEIGNRDISPHTPKAWLLTSICYIWDFHKVFFQKTSTRWRGQSGYGGSLVKLLLCSIIGLKPSRQSQYLQLLHIKFSCFYPFDSCIDC